MVGKERSEWPLRCKGSVEGNRELKEKELQKFKTTGVEKAQGCHNFLIYLVKSARVSSLEQNEDCLLFLKNIFFPIL